MADRAEPRSGVDQLVQAYLAWLKHSPYTSRAITSGVLTSLGPIISHRIVHKSFAGIPWARVFAYAAYG